MIAMRLLPGPVRLSFRSRLALTITGVFVVAGVALVAVVYLLVSSLFDRALMTSTEASSVQPAMPLSLAVATLPSDTIGYQTGFLGAPGIVAVPGYSVTLRSADDPDGTVSDMAGVVGPADVGGPTSPGAPGSGTPSTAATPADPATVATPSGDTVPPGAADFTVEPASDNRGLTAEVAMGPDGSVVIGESSQAALAIRTWYVDKSQGLAGDVLTGLLIWSGVALVVFAGLAALASWWLARRSLRRIGEVTRMAQDLSTRDLHRRLDLPGPSDEIKELADTIDAMLNRLETAFASQDRFVANASHELRTPLTTTRTALEIPLAQGRVPAELEPAIRTALRAGERSERLITSLLSLARGATDLEPAEVDLAEVVSEGIEVIAEDLGDVTVHLTNESAVVTGDSTMLEQAVGNLLDNALRHNVPDGQIWIDLHRDENTAVLTVSNTGVTVPAEEVELLTEPFYRAGASRTTSGGTAGHGVGLGLSIVQRIAETHGAQLVLAPRDGGGLVAQLRLPLTP